jgi:hypothetical protein
VRLVPLILLLALAPLAAPSPASGASAGGGLGVAQHVPASPTLLVQATSFGAVTTLNAYSGEPNLATGPDGTVYVTGLASGGTMVFRRLPNDTAFAYLGVPDHGFGGNDEDVATGVDGSVWVAGLYGFFSPTGACASATGSATRGDSWGPTVPGLCELHRGIDRPWIAVDDHGDPWVVVHEICCSGQHAAYRSTDGGATFSLVSATTVVGGFPGNLFVDRAHGRIFEATNCSPPGVGIVAACALSSPTATPLPVWQTSVVARYGSGPPGLAHVAGGADDAGNVYVAWIDKSLSDVRPGVYVARSTDDGLTWSMPARVSDATRLGTMPWVAAGANGDVAVVWYETTALVSDPNFAPSTATWNVEAALIHGWSGDALAAPPAPTRLQLSSVPLKTGAICTRGAACSGDRQLLDFFEAAVGPEGQLHVVWPDVANGPWVLRVADVDAQLR